MTTAQDGGKVVSLTYRNPRKYTWYSFLLEVESTTGPSPNIRPNFNLLKSILVSDTNRHDRAIYTQAFWSVSTTAGYRTVHASSSAATVRFSYRTDAGYVFYRKVSVASFLSSLWRLINKTAVYIHEFLAKRLDVYQLSGSRSARFHERERTAIRIFCVVIILCHKFRKPSSSSLLFCSYFSLF
jgi:hypothetical protein